MKVVVQRVNYSKLTIDNKIYSEINNGLLVLVGVTNNDDLDDISWLSKKIINLRIFNDENNIMLKMLSSLQTPFDELSINVKKSYIYIIMILYLLNQIFPYQYSSLFL